MKANVKATSKNTESTSTRPRKSGPARYSGTKSGAGQKRGASLLSAKSTPASSRLSTPTGAARNGSSPRGRRTGPKEKPISVGLGEHLEIDRSNWARVDAMTDADIERAIVKDPDTFTADDWTDAELVMPVKKRSIHLRIDPDVLDYFRGTGRGYLTRMNGVLRAYAQAHQRKASEKLA
jgi:uncharacterized protein (DUF4415 family)